MTKPVLLQVGPLPAWDEGPLGESFDMRRLFEATDAATFLAEVGAEVRGIVTRGDLGANRAMIEACPNLEIVVVYGVGFDAVDLDACRERGVRVTNTPDVLTKDVADFGVAMMLGLSRNLVAGEAWVRSGDWAAHGVLPLSRRVWGKRAGVLGLGRIGYQIARRLAAFDMQISYSDVAPKDYAADWAFVADPVDLARQSDYFFVALAASAETRHIVGREVIEAVGPEGMIINISRAANIDEQALIPALSAGTLGAAALDVFEDEPNLDPRFLDLPNVLLQPHQASGTVETRKDMGQLMRDNLTAHFSGRPLLTKVI